MKYIFDLIKKEKKRQKQSLLMIPSENISYPEVRQAVGSVLMHKYAEGQPNKRYYQGNLYVDQIEKECEKQALKAFGLSNQQWDANVQPYSGSPANLAIYNALLKPGDRILSMYLPDGGHLSHGWQLPAKKITLVSKLYKVKFYHVNRKTQVFDYAQISKIAQAYKPCLIISGGTAYPREIQHKKLGQIAKSVGSYYLADISHEAGLVAGKANQSPFPYADVVMMTTHKTLRGPRGAIIICRQNLIDQINFSIFPGLQGGPHLHTIAGIAIALKNAQSNNFSNYAKQVVLNAKTLANRFSHHNLTVVSGGTDKHLVLLDLRAQKLNGWFVAWALEMCNIIVNRNTIPYDTASPYYPSGLRLGTPILTVRGMKKKEMNLIADWIYEAIEHLGPRRLPNNQAERNMVLKSFKQEIKKDKFYQQIKTKVVALCNKFPQKDL